MAAPPARPPAEQYEGTVIALTVEEQKFVERMLVRELKRRAVAQGIGVEEELVVRDFDPEEDLGAPDKEFNQSGLIPHGDWGLIYSGKNPDFRVFGIYGIKDETPTALSGNVQKTLYWQGGGQSGYEGALARPAVSLKFMLGAAKVKDIWHLQRMYVEHPPMVFTMTPVIYNKDEDFRIYAFARKPWASGAFSNLVFIGKVCEPKGKVIMGIE